MTNKKSGCGTMVAGALFAGLAFSYAATFGVGYWMRGREDENTQVCHDQVAPLRKQFKDNCEGRLYDEVDQKALEGIIGKRNDLQNQFGCEKEKWVCRPVDQYRVQESKTEAVYKLE